MTIESCINDVIKLSEKRGERSRITIRSWAREAKLLDLSRSPNPRT